ncbi:MAG: transcription-repair coupling factor [Bacteroidaceae bacterium]|nr:transcription-repair coupling factor [Bacteroidaceae bacterium]
MEVKEIQNIYAAHPGIDALMQLREEGGKKHALLEGLSGSSAAMIFCGLKERIPEQTLLIVMNDAEEAGYFYHDMMQIANDNSVLFFPSSFRRAMRYGQEDDANRILRTEVMSRLANRRRKEGLVIVTHPEALAEKVVSQQHLEEKTLTIAVGDNISRDEVEKKLSALKFKEVTYVYEPGEFAVRGSLIDIFSFSSEFPYRIDFFGDEVESIRTFTVEDQLSKERTGEATIVPKLTDSQAVAITEFLPKNAILVTKDITFIRGCIDKLNNEGFTLQARLSDEDLPRMPELMTAAEVEKYAKSTKHWQLRPQSVKNTTKVKFDTSPQPLFHKDFDLVSQNFKRLLDEGYKLFLLTDDLHQANRLKAIFEERGDDIPFTPIGRTIHEGFCDNTLKIALFTDHQLFGRFHNFRLRSERARNGKAALTIKELKEFGIGDYIVHIDHGIGKFGGLVRIPNGGVTQEAIKLIYRNDDVVFVSIHNLHKISKYRGKEGDAPQVSKLGTGAWERMKERTKSKIKDIARDLIKLYSQRYKEEGFAFSPDSYLQNELEASFIYEDTPDQFKATNEVKQDMERKRPMDRLICGDVGFGKTEVAIRAAFKAATDGKQVAVLVPTTVLAYQHYLTFKERLKDFPCNVQYLSRARNASTTKKVLEEIKEGKVDIVIGTHKLTSKEVKFKDLGLLIIDEEQKFGVAVKEKLRQLKVNVDTLTMTATPIPRTLQFSIMGARDLSVIQTPPPNRYPIHTEIHNFDAEVIKEAIGFELSRNGQVFLITNRISGMEELANMIRRHVPDARVCIGHGQMEPAELEKRLYEFINHDHDVLIATSIVENGIDIPNVNTIIINQAQNFGLSDLHQMRGRVGRGKRKAFCYMLTPPRESLNTDARRRLEAIESFSELGSGMSIAMQDLDIRGAGNLLGAEQSGFIADLGYEAYQKVLAEAVRELKEDEFADILMQEESESAADNYVKECFVESDLELLFPALYVPDSNERILLYRELDSLTNSKEIEAFRARMKDRFGTIPQEGEELIRVVTMRHEAQKLGIEKIYLKGGKMNLFLVDTRNERYYTGELFGSIMSYIPTSQFNCKVREGDGRCIITVENVKNVETALAFIEEIQRHVNVSKQTTDNH